MKPRLACFLIIFILSQSLVINFNEPFLESDNVESIPNSESTFVKRQAPSSVKMIEISESQIQEQQFEVVVFESDPMKRNMLSDNFRVTHEYNNLGALRMFLTDSDIRRLSSSFSNIYPYSTLHSLDLRSSATSSQDIEASQIEPLSGLIGMSSLWDMGYNGTGVTAAIIDNGIDFSHPALWNKKIGEFDISADGTTPCKDHGTPVAGALAAAPIDNLNQSVGMGYGVKLVDISVGCKGLGVVSGDFLAGFDYILENNETIDIVNTSFGGVAPAWDFILSKLESAGIIVVGSAGNDGPDYHTTPTGGPGNSLNAISVGLTDFNKQISALSARGPTHKMLYKPDLVAPGIDINTTNHFGTYGLYSGTSFSSPIVAGGIATIISGLNVNGIS
ncbi:MAG: S8 family peptidase, partial [Candidatus Kariarchaeaceae archaeon]